MRDFIYIGGTPAEESCAQTGVTENAQRWNRLECQTYIAALRKKYGPEPQGARFKIKTESGHDAGTYYEVVCEYDDSNEKAAEYAFGCEMGLGTWAEANFRAPICYDANSQAVEGTRLPVEWCDLDKPRPTMEQLREYHATGRIPQ